MEVEGLEQQAEQQDNEQLAVARLVELVSVAAASVNLLVLHSHNSHIKRSVQAWAAAGLAGVHSIAGYMAQGVPDAAAAAAAAELPLQPSTPCNLAVPVEAEEDQEAEGVVGECNSAEVQMGFCSLLKKKLGWI